MSLPPQARVCRQFCSLLGAGARQRKVNPAGRSVRAAFVGLPGAIDVHDQSAVNALHPTSRVNPLPRRSLEMGVCNSRTSGTRVAQSDRKWFQPKQVLPFPVAQSGRRALVRPAADAESTARSGIAVVFVSADHDAQSGLAVEEH